MSEHPVLTVEIRTPSGRNECFSCDSLHLTLANDGSGRAGGDIGIHPGHCPALMALAAGPATGFSAGRPAFRRHLGSGLAEVNPSSVTILVDSCTDSAI